MQTRIPEGKPGFGGFFCDDWMGNKEKKKIFVKLKL
jgi:hypothetical protein